MSLATFGSDLRAWLAAQGVGTAGTDLFRGQFPQDVLEGLLLAETGGERGDRPRGHDLATVQFTARSQTLATALAKAHQVYALVNEPSNVRTMGPGSTRVVYSKALQPPFTLGQDERQAWRVIFNAEFILAR